MSSDNHPGKTQAESGSPYSCLILPDAPESLSGPVKAWEELVEILTYEPAKPDLNPMFLEKRVYQGSSGRVYPLPFIDRVATKPKKRTWRAIHIENEFLRIMVLPEIGGRIHVGYDKTTGYDFFYRQNVIKPALVGLAGPWISGGVEFNWPQHHRPATFMPVETSLEYDQDGSVTVWCSDHDPMLRMKGMHGICLRPGRSVLDLKVRLYNRTQFTQTFLWWANVATRVHEKYQSFFPTDVRFVADHAKRAVTTFPQSNGMYYGINYAERARTGVPADEAPANFGPDGSYPANDLSWYSNIPVPTSYMVAGIEQNFFGGYDHAAHAGVVHVANHHISPGKKQWTWGNHEFGYAWDRNLTDNDGPYIELMAGVYTDNQPDFSFLAPWETKTFVQHWFPLHSIGVPQAANTDAALSLRRTVGAVEFGLYVTSNIGNVKVTLRAGSVEIVTREAAVGVANPLQFTAEIPAEVQGGDLSAMVTTMSGVLIEYDESRIVPAKAPVISVEPLSPAEIETNEELYLTGLHLHQYRHATRLPELYWREALNRDEHDARSNNAMGLWRLRRGEFEQAKQHFSRAIARLTRFNPNPSDGEPYYNLGVTERFLGNDKEAYDAFYKATWNATWKAASYLALAEIDATRRDWNNAHEHAKRSLSADADNLATRNLLWLTYKELGRLEEATKEHQRILELDPLDLMSRYRDGFWPSSGHDALDLAIDLLRVGQKEEAVQLMRKLPGPTSDGSFPILLHLLAQTEAALGIEGASCTLDAANHASLAYCFPSRLEELLVLQNAAAAAADQPSVFYLLGNFFYDRRRHEDAIDAWEKAVALDPLNTVALRNLGIAMFNVRGNAQSATDAFDRAFAANPGDGRLLYERDQLWKRIGIAPGKRLAELRQHMEIVNQRDDLSVELVTLYNQLGEPRKALEILTTRQFQPWEGGEGLVLGQYVRARLLYGRIALGNGDAETALQEFRASLVPPPNLSEARHLLVNQSDIHFWLGKAYSALGNRIEASESWKRAARQTGDFQQMSVRSISDMTYWGAMANVELGRNVDADQTFQQILDYSIELERTEPKVDYFATSLPAMLLFEDDLVRRNEIEAKFLRAQALAGLGQTEESSSLLQRILALDGSHAGAADLQSQLSNTVIETR
jgi:tetratricopeptide (TPR) repeat protein